MSESVTIVAKNLRSLRGQKHITQKELARATHVAEALISEIERGIANPTLQTLEKLATYLQTTVAAFVDSDSQDIILQTKCRLIAEILCMDQKALDTLSRYLSRSCREQDSSGNP